MKKATKGIYTFEQILYTLLLIPMFIGHVMAIQEPEMLILSMGAQFVMGCAQVLSGLLHTVVYSDSKRAKYLGGALGFVMLLILVVTVMDSLSFTIINGGIPKFIAVLFMIIIPSGIAIWYTIQTNIDRKLAEATTKKPKQIKYDEDLLDDIHIVR